jgi:hypothetical protein
MMLMYLQDSVPDPYPDPYVFGSPGSASESVNPLVRICMRIRLRFLRLSHKNVMNPEHYGNFCSTPIVRNTKAYIPVRNSLQGSLYNIQRLSVPDYIFNLLPFFQTFLTTRQQKTKLRKARYRLVIIFMQVGSGA